MEFDYDILDTGEVIIRDYFTHMWAGSMVAPEGDLTIPGEIDGFKVAAIGLLTFAGLYRITSVVIPEGVRSICCMAFKGCSKISKVTLPKSLNRIGYAAFARCELLSEVHLPPGLQILENEAFSHCFNLREIVVPAVDYISKHAFYYCYRLSRLSLSDGTKAIGYGAFGNCENLTGVAIPRSVKTIDQYAFHGCSALTELGLVPGLVDIGGFAFGECTSLENVDLPNGLEHIGPSAFSGCTSLACVTIPRSVTSIGSQAFFRGGKLTLRVEAGSLAERYAKDNGIPYTFMEPLADCEAEYKAFYKENYVSLDEKGMPPELLSKYTLESCVKDTATNSVYLVSRNSDDKPCLLKVSRMDSADDAGIEAEILNSIKHNNIPQVLDFWKHEQCSYLVREYMEGTPLDIAREKNSGFSVADILDAALKIGDTLSDLENLNIVHRDIKPGNIILTEDGEYKIIDFGITRKYGAEKTRDTVIAGTKGYTAPEQLGDFGQTTPSADRYSLGKTLLFLATGSNDLAELRNIQDAGLKHLIEILTNNDPKKRFRSAVEMKEHIRYLIDGIDPLSIEGLHAEGNILTTYTGNDKRLILYNVAYILPEAFAENGESVEEIRLCANFSATSVPALRMLKNLACVETDVYNDELVSCDGVLYDKRTNAMLFCPPKKAGKCRLPFWLTDITAEAYADLCCAKLLTDFDDEGIHVSLDAFVAGVEAKGYLSYQGVLYSGLGDELILCPRARSGEIELLPSVKSIREQAFHGCIALTDMAHIARSRVRYLGRPLCALFDGCSGLPEQFQHQLCRYDKSTASEHRYTVKCLNCNEIYDPRLRGTTLTEKAIETIDEEISERMQYSRWCTTGERIAWGVDDPETFDSALASFPFKDLIPFGTTLYRIQWGADSNVCADITEGTLGGWIENKDCLGNMAWVGAGAVVLDGGRVFGKARVESGTLVERGGFVYDYAVARNGALIRNGAEIYGHAQVAGAYVALAHIYGHAVVDGDKGHGDGHYQLGCLNELANHTSSRWQALEALRIFDNNTLKGPYIRGFKGSSREKDNIPRILDSARVAGHAHIIGGVTICENAYVHEDAHIHAYARVCGNAKVHGEAVIHDLCDIGDDVEICGSADVAISLKGSQKISEGKLWK